MPFLKDHRYWIVVGILTFLTCAVVFLITFFDEQRKAKSLVECERAGNDHYACIVWVRGAR